MTDGKSDLSDSATLSARIPPSFVLALIGAIGVGGYSFGSKSPPALKTSAITNLNPSHNI